MLTSVYKPFNLEVTLKVVSWIKSFLRDRNQSVVVEGKRPPVECPPGLCIGGSSLTNEKDHHYFLNRFVCVGEFFDG